MPHGRKGHSYQRMSGPWKQGVMTKQLQIGRVIDCSKARSQGAEAQLALLVDMAALRFQFCSLWVKAPEVSLPVMEQDRANSTPCMYQLSFVLYTKNFFFKSLDLQLPYWYLKKIYTHTLTVFDSEIFHILTKLFKTKDKSKRKAPIDVTALILTSFKC